MDEAKITVVIISAIVSLISIFISFLLKSTILSHFHVFKLEKDHEYEQRKKIKEVISYNKTRIIDAAESLDHRLWNFNKNYEKEWHIYCESLPLHNQYYLSSFVYRMLIFCAWCNLIEKQMIYLDTTVATDKDLYFVKFLKIFPRILCNVGLFEGLNYDSARAKDHFFKNTFTAMVEQVQKNGVMLTYDEFQSEIKAGNIDVKKMVNFLSGISPKERRLRWYRLQIMHFALVMFINTFGYDFQYTNLSKVKKLKDMQPENLAIKNMVTMLKKFKLLKSREVSVIISIIDP